MSSKNYFEEVSQDWDVMSNEFFGEAPRAAIYEQIGWNNTRTMADIGCGSGYLSEGAIDRNVRIIAVDQSREMLGVMEQKLGTDKVDYRVGNSDDLPIQSDSIDVVMANMYLHHVEKPETALGEMYRILKDGGQLIFTDLDKHDHHWLVEEQHDRWMGFERKDIEEWVKSVGFKDVVLDCVGADCCTTSSCGKGDAAVSIFIASGYK